MSQLLRVGNRWDLRFGAMVIATAVLVATVPAKSADSNHGAELFKRCAGCHALEANPATPLPGPSLAGIFGRQAGTLPSYTHFSQAMKDSGIVWNDETMDRFLASSDGAVSGNKMIDVEIADKGDRDDLIAYMKQVAAGH